jgi:hypothetical protein
VTENDKGLKPTRISELVVLAAVAAVATWILIRVFYGSMPPIPVYAGASLYFVAVAEAVFAFVIRSRVKNRQVGDGLRQLHPITAARALALAKASALVGSATVGVWVGVLVYLIPQLGSAGRGLRHAGRVGGVGRRNCAGSGSSVARTLLQDAGRYT